MYPWDKWIDPDSRGDFQWGVHFDCKPEAFAKSLRGALAGRKIKASVRVHGQYVSYRPLDV